MNFDMILQMNEITGLQYIPQFITQAEHNSLIMKIDNQPWLNDLKRRVQHYGYKYDYKAKKIDMSMHLGNLPDWLLELAYKLYDHQLFAVLPDQVIVNEYLPGQGISKHIDCISCFSDTIISLSLGSGCIMDFSNVEAGVKIPVFLEPHSIVIMTDKARYQWSHSIPARKVDRFQGHIIKRERRISLTFRKVILTHN